MAVFDHSARQQFGFVSALATRAVRFGKAAIRAWNNRRQFRRLHDMSDWELADIGLSRDDLRDAWKRRVDTPAIYLSVESMPRPEVRGISLVNNFCRRGSIEYPRCG